MEYSFLEQPRDLITDNQLIFLPVKDLLAVCQSNKQLDALCKRKDFWVARIQREFPILDVATIEDPRDYYLRKVLFLGQIYIHRVSTQNNEIISETEQIPTEIIEYDQLFPYIKQIAEKSGSTYIIIYSTPSPADNFLDYPLDAFNLKLVGFQTHFSSLIAYNSDKATLVDIILMDDNGPFNNYINAINNYNTKSLEPPTPPYSQVYMGLINEVTIIIEHVEFFHKHANTALYRRETNIMNNLRDSKLRNTTSNPIIPRNYHVSGRIDVRKQRIIDKILNNHPFYVTDIGFSSVLEFQLFQRDYVENLDETQLQAIELLVDGLLSIIVIGDDEQTTSRICFTNTGRIMLF